MATRTTDPTIFVDLTEGLADRNRLPLSHVIKVLREVESMVNDVGSRILHERGLEDQNPNFGIEIVAENSVAFKTGSVRATIDRKSTRLNSSHLVISYAVFCLK